MGKIHTLAKNGDLAGVQALLSAGGLVDETDRQEQTALHIAAAGGHTDLVKYLVTDKEADVDAEDKAGNCPLHLAAGAGHLETVQALLEKSDEDATNGDDNSVVWAALANGHTEVARAVLDAGADINLHCQGGATYLHQACSKRSTAAVEMLLSRGAAVDSLDAERCTPLMRALQAGAWAAATALIEAGANVKATGRDSWTPLHFCAQNKSGAVGAVDCAELLVKKGAPVSALTRDGLKPSAVVGQDCGKRSRVAADEDEEMRGYLGDMEDQDQD